MKLLKMFPWVVRVLCWLTLIAGAVPVHAAPEPVDPLAGEWLYYRNNPATFNADGTASMKGGWHGTWEYLHNPEVQRHYQIVWNQGKSIDTLVLAEDGQHAHVHNDTGAHHQYDVRRAISTKRAVVSPAPTAPPVAARPASAPIPPPLASTDQRVTPTTASAAAAPGTSADPILGAWRWPQQRLMVFNADGTVTASKGPAGTWASLHNPDAERKYRVDWGNGKYIDTISVDPNDAQTAHVESNKGARYTVRRTAPTESATPTNFFGAPGH